MRKKRYKKGVPYSVSATRIYVGINREIMNIPMTGDVCNLNYNIALIRLFCAIIVVICACLFCADRSSDTKEVRVFSQS